MTVNGVHTNGVALVNGHSAAAATTTTTTPSRLLRPGIYAPIPTFFKQSPDASEDEELDLPPFESHVVRLASSGVWPVISGSMGEGHHLLHSERTALIQSARRALDNAGMSDVPIIAGTGTGSLKETLILTKEAADAGADYGIVIMSGYFAGALVADKNALVAFWSEIAQKSPIPILIYNYPGASGGIDLDSDTILTIARSSPKVVGVKLTCGNVGKLTRIAASSPSLKQDFLVLGGYTDFVVPSSFANGHGAITGLANLIPNACVKLFEMTEQLKATLLDPPSSPLKTNPNLLAETIRLQGIIAEADRAMALGSISGTKAMLERVYGYGGKPRRPLPGISEENAEKLWNHPSVRAALREEKLAASEKKEEMVL